MLKNILTFTKALILSLYSNIKYLYYFEDNSKQRILIKNLRDAFKKYPIYKITTADTAENNWNRNIERLKYLILNKDLRCFLTWDVIQKTMFVTYSNYVFKELLSLKNDHQWETKWKNVIREDKIGCPIPYLWYPKSSGNRIHHAYHLSKFEQYLKTDLKKMEVIFEFGGGYGNTCCLLYKLGFKGKYILYDLPPFSELQKFYLKSLNLPVIENNKQQPGIYCISDFNELQKLLNFNSFGIESMFIATWSLSESPMELRKKVTPLLKVFKWFLFAYQDQFGEINNTQYFNNFVDNHANIDWFGWKIKFIPGNNYLMGKKKEKIT